MSTTFSRHDFRSPLAAGAILLASGAVTALGQPTMIDPRLRAEVVAAGLGEGQLVCCTGICFVAPRVALVVSRADGRVRRLDLSAGQVAVPGATVLDLPIVTATLTDDQSEYGVQGLSLHPGFSSNGWVYVKYDRSRLPDADIPQAAFDNFADPAENVIERYVWNPLAGPGGTSEPASGLLEFDQRLVSVPLNTRYHHGGPIAFGPATGGTIRMFTGYGDLRNDGYLAKNVPAGLVDLPGTIASFTDGGLPAPGNPFGPGSGSPPGTEAWFAYGSRNSFGLAVDPITGDLWQTDNGEFLYDEVNRVPPGANLGWSRIMGPIGHPRQTGSIAGLAALPGSQYQDPSFAWFQTQGVTSIHFLAGSALGPAWDDGVIVANYNTGYVWLFRLDGERRGFVLNNPGLRDRVDDRVSFLANPIGTEAAELLWGRNFNPPFRGVVSMTRGVDGLPYLLTAAGQLIRIGRTCPADWNADGVLDPDDLSGFIGAYFAAPPGRGADFNGDGSVDPDDLSDAITSYFGGC